MVVHLVPQPVVFPPKQHGASIEGAREFAIFRVAGKVHLNGLVGLEDDDEVESYCKDSDGDEAIVASNSVVWGFKTMIWTCASGFGPILGGALSEKASWRWLFYINAPGPASASAFIFVLFFLQMRTPEGNVWSKLALVDWLGNVLIITGTVLSNLSLTWAGVRYAWSDARVLAPLIAGLALMVAFVVYEKYVPRVPTMPWEAVTDRTALASLIATFLNGITSMSIIYFLPLFFQAVFLASPMQSAIYSLPSKILVSPFNLNGIVVMKVKCYLPGNYVGWVLIVVGFALLSMLSAKLIRILSDFLLVVPTHSTHPRRTSGICARIPEFLADLLANVGITISASILQNTVEREFPAQFIAELPAGSDLAFAAISGIASLPAPLQQQVQAAFGHGIRDLYRVMMGVVGLGFVCVLFMKEVPMRSEHFIICIVVVFHFWGFGTVIVS
ncbi:hypothetical protein C8R44DRAFT_875811 [Mycena epipterygia]|nr:hypothetical protein C8R44DRAFT_875811 [Mycena epipterygia]